MLKKMFVLVEGGKAEEIANAIKRAAHASGKEIVQDPEDADVILVNTHDSALKMLKENDEAVVIISIFPWIDDDIGARALKDRYPDRIVICQDLENNLKPGDKMLVPYIMGIGKEDEVKN